MKRNETDNLIRARTHVKNIEICSRFYDLVNHLDETNRKEFFDRIKIKMQQSWPEHRSEIQIQPQGEQLIISYDCLHAPSKKRYKGVFTFSERKAVIEERSPYDPRNIGFPYQYYTRQLTVENSYATLTGGSPDEKNTDVIDVLSTFMEMNLNIPELTTHLEQYGRQPRMRSSRFLNQPPHEQPLRQQNAPRRPERQELPAQPIEPPLPRLQPQTKKKSQVGACISMLVLGSFITCCGIAAVALAFTLLNAATCGLIGLITASIGAVAILGGLGLFGAGLSKAKPKERLSEPVAEMQYSL